MGEFISSNLKINLKEAKILQEKYFIENGTTLHGLMVNHNINPKKYLEYVHDIDFSIIKPDKELNDLIKKVPGKKIVFTMIAIFWSATVRGGSAMAASGSEGNRKGSWGLIMFPLY